jgi:hypothetical protein
MKGLGSLLWKISVACYLIANGALGLKNSGKSDFYIILGKVFSNENSLDVFVKIASVIALIAGICLLLEFFKIQIPHIDTLILVIAIIWIVYIVFEIIWWVGGNNYTFFENLQRLAVHLMVLGSLLIASGKFE